MEYITNNKDYQQVRRDIKILGRNKTLNKDKLGFVPQELSLIPDLSIKDNIKKHEKSKIHEKI